MYGVRKFNGKAYSLDSARTKKEFAKAAAEDFRKKGYLVRVITHKFAMHPKSKGTGVLYDIYVRRKK